MLMPVEVAMAFPAPRWAWLAMLAIVPAWWIARVLARGLGGAMASVSVFALWIAILLIAYHIAGLTVGAFYPGLGLGSAVLVVLGAWLRLTTSAACPLPAVKLPRSLTLVTVGSVLALIPCVVYYDFHDKAYATMGHLSFANDILNGSYPPLDLHNPQQTLHYHYGVDLAAALIAVTVGIAADYAFDSMTLVLWAYVLVLVGVLGENMIGAGRGWVAALMACFGGGVPWIADADPVLGKKLVLLYEINGIAINPPPISYFFQHPWTIGLPLAFVWLGALLIFPLKEQRFKLHIVLAIVATALAISNATLALALPAASIGAIVLTSIELRRIQWAALNYRLAHMIVVIAALLLLSGFGQHLLAAERTLELVPLGGVAGNIKSTVVWNIATFGIILPLGLVGCWCLRGQGYDPLCLAVGGVIIANVVSYRLSPDAFKFAQVAEIALTIGAAMVICGLISRTVVAWTLLIFALAPGVSFATSGLLNPQHHPLPRSVRSGIGDYTLSADEARIITYLRENAAGSQLLAANYMQGLAFAIYGGLPQYFCSPEERPFIPEAECERRSRVMIDLTSGLSTLAEDGVRWLVLPTEMAENLGSAYPANVVECLKTPGFVLLRISDGGSDIGCGRARLSSEMWSGP